ERSAPHRTVIFTAPRRYIRALQQVHARHPALVLTEGLANELRGGDLRGRTAPVTQQRAPGEAPARAAAYLSFPKRCYLDAQGTGLNMNELPKSIDAPKSRSVKIRPWGRRTARDLTSGLHRLRSSIHATPPTVRDSSSLGTIFIDVLFAA